MTRAMTAFSAMMARSEGLTSRPPVVHDGLHASRLRRLDRLVAEDPDGLQDRAEHPLRFPLVAVSGDEGQAREGDASGPLLLLGDGGFLLQDGLGAVVGQIAAHALSPVLLIGGLPHGSSVPSGPVARHQVSRSWSISAGLLLWRTRDHRSPSALRSRATTSALMMRPPFRR